MKTILSICGAIAISAMSYAQVKAPQPSPKSKIEQVIGLTDVTVEYSRPGVKDRKIFGDLVPFDKMWRTGANKNTVISFSDDVKIEGKELKKGSYAMFTKPGKSAWDVVFYSDTENWGTPKEWDEAKVALKVSVKPIEIPSKIENFMIVFDNLKNNSGEMELLWDNVYVPMKIEVPSDKTTMASIDRALNGPTARDYYSAASYFLDEGKDMNKALTWINKAVEMDGKDTFWMLRKKSLIEAKLGKTKDAIATAKKSLASAEKAGNADYVKMNKDSIKEWGS